MLGYYKPEGQDNVHFIRITFMYQEFVGHVTLMHGGNIKGADMLREALEFWVYADDDYMNSLVENDCKLKLHHSETKDEYWYSMEMKHVSGRDEYLIHDDLNDIEIQDMIVKVEIASYKEE